MTLPFLSKSEGNAHLQEPLRVVPSVEGHLVTFCCKDQQKVAALLLQSIAAFAEAIVVVKLGRCCYREHVESYVERAKRASDFLQSVIKFLTTVKVRERIL